MPEDDPTDELSEIQALYHDGQLPKAAVIWAEQAMVTAEEILDKIEEMEGNGYSATTDQETALENIYTAACNWLKRRP